MPQPRYITKSRFKLAVECPTKLFYTGKTKIYRDSKQMVSLLQMLAEGGYQVGELAKCQYPQGIEAWCSKRQVQQPGDGDHDGSAHASSTTALS